MNIATTAKWLELASQILENKNSIMIAHDDGCFTKLPGRELALACSIAAAEDIDPGECFADGNLDALDDAPEVEKRALKRELQDLDDAPDVDVNGEELPPHKIYPKDFPFDGSPRC